MERKLTKKDAWMDALENMMIAANALDLGSVGSINYIGWMRMKSSDNSYISMALRSMRP